MAAVLTVAALPFTGRVLWVAYGPVDDDPVAQLRYLDAALRDGGAEEMQGLFPEGEFFTWVLTGVAAGRVAQDPDVSAADRAFARDLAERALAAVDEPAVADRFGQGATSGTSTEAAGGLEHGIFYRGWRLTLLDEIATWDDGAAARAGAEAGAILAAVDASPTGWVDSYPGQAWPCDQVVALAAATTADPQAAAPVVARWLARTGDALDPATGLLAHRVDRAGRADGGARGTSQSLVVTFWPQLSDDPAPWASYTDTFVVSRLGAVGALEYPHGRGDSDVDSGPLVLGLSASASAVTQAAARANGDTALADRLNRQIELFALPWQTGDQRTYLFGRLPVAVAFFVWADTTPVGEGTSSAAPRPAWWALATLPALPALVVCAVLGAVSLRRHRRAGSRSEGLTPIQRVELVDRRQTL